MDACLVKKSPEAFNSEKDNNFGRLWLLFHLICGFYHSEKTRKWSEVAGVWKVFRMWSEVTGSCRARQSVFGCGRTWSEVFKCGRSGQEIIGSNCLGRNY